MLNLIKMNISTAIVLVAVFLSLNNAQLFLQTEFYDTAEGLVTLIKMRDDLKKPEVFSGDKQFIQVHVCSGIVFSDILRYKNSKVPLTYPRKVEILFGSYTAAQKNLIDNSIVNIANNTKIFEDEDLYNEGISLCGKLTKAANDLK